MSCTEPVQVHRGQRPLYRGSKIIGTAVPIPSFLKSGSLSCFVRVSENCWTPPSLFLLFVKFRRPRCGSERAPIFFPDFQFLGEKKSATSMLRHPKSIPKSISKLARNLSIKFAQIQSWAKIALTRQCPFKSLMFWKVFICPARFESGVCILRLHGSSTIDPKWPPITSYNESMNSLKKRLKWKSMIFKKSWKNA